MRNMLRRAVLGLAVVLAATASTPASSLGAASIEVSAHATPSISRISGDDRYGTAAAIAAAWPTGTDVVYIATGADFPDALAATSMAGRADAPVLLTRSGELPSSTRSALKRLKPTEVVLVGGTSAVTQEVARQLRSLSADKKLTRVTGSTRYETAAELAVKYPKRPATVYLARGDAFADALSGASLSAMQRAPLLLTGPGKLHPAARRALTHLSPTSVVVLGGTGALPDTVAKEASALTRSKNFTRLGGNDRYATSALVARQYPTAGGTTYLASGRDFPDALVGGALASRGDAPVVLTDPSGVAGVTVEALRKRLPTDLTAFGGTKALPGAHLESLVRAVSASATPAPDLEAVGGSGSLPLGQASYPVPSAAIFVSLEGKDGNPGTQRSPLRTMTAAMAKAPSGGTIVLRGGTYHEAFVISKKLTIQNYPGERVWFDGSQRVEAFRASGGTWVKSGWTTQFDSSPTYTFGARDGRGAGWGFVDPNFPMAAHPDQVWVDGVAQRQVESLGQVTAGTFFVDYATQRLHLGSDPRGKDVRASTLARAIAIRAEDVTLRGFGVRRFAPSVPHMGAITAERPRTRVENLIVTDMSTTGLSMLAAGQRIDRVTVARTGLLGVHANQADGLTVSHLNTGSNNTERFNTSPVSGGLKISRTRTVTIDRSSFTGNRGPGLWLDESVHNGTMTKNLLRDNTGHGISLEISARMVVAGNLVQDNGGHGLKVNNTSGVQIWNNTFADNGRPLNIVQDARRGDDPSVPGHDPRRPFPDPDQPWVNGPVTIGNNVVAGSSGNCLICVEDYSKQMSGEQMRVQSSGNIYQRDTPSAPTWLAVWSRGAGNPAVHTTLSSFQKTGQEKDSVDLGPTTAVTDAGVTTSTVRALAATVSRPLPTSVATVVGQPEGTRHLGAFNG